MQSTAGYRFRAAIVGTFAGLALVLAMIGVFGVLAYSVQQRRREFGVRVALGASSPSILWLVLGSAGRLIAVGGTIGLVLAFVLGRSIAAFLFGVPPVDPVTFAGVTVRGGAHGGRRVGGTGMARRSRRSGGDVPRGLRLRPATIGPERFQFDVAAFLVLGPWFLVRPRS